MGSRVGAIKLKFQSKLKSCSRHVNHIVAIEKRNQNQTRLYMDEGKGFWQSLKNTLELTWIYFKVLFRNTREYIKDVYSYYPIKNFAKIDLAVLKQYVFQSPFKISKKFLMQKGEENIYAYGETPLTTFDAIMRKVNLKKEDCLYELGSGRGRNCFWANVVIGCKTVGIEFVPQFVEKANKVKEQFGLKDLEFRQEDMLQTQLKEATVVYLYGTCLGDDEITKLAENCAKVPAGTKIITVSYPLEDYLKDDLFEVMHRFPAEFTWGEADVYVQMRKG